jgi:hypothetical protein
LIDKVLQRIARIPANRSSQGKLLKRPAFARSPRQKAQDKASARAFVAASGGRKGQTRVRMTMRDGDELRHRKLRGFIDHNHIKGLFAGGQRARIDKAKRSIRRRLRVSRRKAKDLLGRCWTVRRHRDAHRTRGQHRPKSQPQRARLAATAIGHQRPQRRNRSSQTRCQLLDHEGLFFVSCHAAIGRIKDRSGHTGRALRQHARNAQKKALPNVVERKRQHGQLGLACQRHHTLGRKAQDQAASTKDQPGTLTQHVRRQPIVKIEHHHRKGLTQPPPNLRGRRLHGRKRRIANPQHI